MARPSIETTRFPQIGGTRSGALSVPGPLSPLGSPSALGSLSVLVSFIIRQSDLLPRLTGSSSFGDAVNLLTMRIPAIRKMV